MKREKYSIKEATINKLERVELGIQAKTNMIENTPSGVLILHINQDSFLNKFGVKFGDVIKKMNDSKINSIQDLKLVTCLNSGDQFVQSIHIERKGEIIKLK